MWIGRGPGILMLMAVRCLLVDDSPPFIEAARGLLGRQGVDIVGVASTGSEALRLAGDLRPDVVLVDIDLGGESGFEVTRGLLEERADPPAVILISTHSETDFADLIAESPATGFLSKSALSADAIHRLLAGDGRLA
jgi:DNA-binding NarL/FixJ family response regulator